jgi:adenosylcobinamide-GDP ribazoletransferase
MTPLRTGARALRAATVLLTRLPVGGFPFSDNEWRWSSAAFPIVGLGIGLTLSLVWWLASPTGPFVSAIVAYTAAVLVTGALHEDGLADTADALGGAKTREQIFVILKDSRVGTFGALALMLSVALRVALVARMGTQAPLGLVASQALARVPPVWLMAALSYVTPHDARNRDVARADRRQIIVASLVGTVVLAVLLALGQVTLIRVAVTVALLAVTGAAAASYFRARAGGITGDFLGALEQVGEIVVLGALAI